MTIDGIALKEIQTFSTFLDAFLCDTALIRKALGFRTNRLSGTAEFCHVKQLACFAITNQSPLTLYQLKRRFMKTILSLFTFLILNFLVLGQARASYFLVSLPSENLDFHKPTHIILTSKGNDLGRGPQLVASSRAKIISQNFPNDQILMILVSSNDSVSNESEIRQMGFDHIQLVNEVLNPKKLMDEMARFEQISSFFFCGHTAIPEGLFLDAIGERDIRWYPSDSQVKRLVGHFTPDAYAELSGCNSGHLMALNLSKVWQIPVAGAITGTHFETLFKDQNFYSADEVFQKSWSTLSFKARYRMRADHINYDGHYGKYLQGLPFFKFFCVGISEEKCYLAMSRSIYGSVSSIEVSPVMSFEQYAAVVRERLCPAGNWGSKLQQSCMHRLENLPPQNTITDLSQQVFSPFDGVTAQCSFLTCYTETLNCSTALKAWDCARSFTPSGHATTFVDEYFHYLKAYQPTNQILTSM
jgi:hypothetical protein